MGAEVALAARIVLAAALAYAAITKLAAGSATRAQFKELLPERIATPVAIVLPYVELAVAVALVAAWTSSIPAFVAIVLLAAFTIVLIRAQLQHVPCPCFGAAGTKPVGASAIVRNGVLLALAVLATAEINDPSVVGTALLTIALGVLTVVAVYASR